MKICVTCNTEKPLEEFYKRKDGFIEIRCKKCHLDKYSPNRGKSNLGRYKKGNIPFTRKEVDGRQSLRAKQWCKDIKMRDNYVCTICGSIKMLHAHHIKDWYKYPELRFELSNGITLCNPCHARLHGKECLNLLKNGITWNKGKEMSLKSRKKMSESHKGKIPWNKGKRKNGLFGDIA